MLGHKTGIGFGSTATFPLCSDQILSLFPGK